MVTSEKIFKPLLAIFLVAFFATFGPTVILQFEPPLLPSYVWNCLMQLPVITVLWVLNRSFTSIHIPSSALWINIPCILSIMGIVFWIMSMFPPLLVPGLDNFALRPIFTTTNQEFLIGSLLLAPLFEEVIYRGLLPDYLSKFSWPSWVVCILTSALFSLFHFNSKALIPLFILGMLLYWVKTKHDNILASILTHLVYNGVLISLMLFL